MGHKDSHREATSMARETRADTTARKYRVRWLGFPPEQDMRELRFSLLRDIPDVVQAYDLIDFSHPVLYANVNALVVNESDETTHDVEDENNVEVENVVVTGFHHDQENETLLRGARQDREANVSPPYTGHSAETGSVFESYDASAVRHA